MAFTALLGFVDAQAALKLLPDRVKVNVQQEMDTTAYQVAAAAKSRAPRRTGALEMSVQWQSKPRQVGAIVGITPSAFYWKFVEYGTVKMPARPFIRPAADAIRESHERRLREALGRASDDTRSAAVGRFL